ncbi:MAG: hypothetical protein WC789_04235 [Lentisphaeria bacterium]|jgi:hypothetical protein
MNDWWSGLSLELQIYYGIGIVFTLILVIQTLLLVAGGTGEGDASAEAVDTGGEPTAGEADVAGLHLLSVRGVTAFFVGFGWAGVLAARAGLDSLLAGVVALVAGSVFLVGVGLLMRALYALRSSGTLDYRNAIGRVGTVYIAVPPAGDGSGQVEVMIQGRLTLVEASNAGASRIPINSKVKVVALLDERTLRVEPLP